MVTHYFSVIVSLLSLFLSSLATWGKFQETVMSSTLFDWSNATNGTYNVKISMNMSKVKNFHIASVPTIQMSSASNIRVDDLEKTIKDLLGEKNTLENRSRKVKQHKNEAQTAVDKTKVKRAHLINVALQLKETLKVAKHKYAETQANFDKITDEVRKIKGQIHNMSTENDGEREKVLKETKEYEVGLKEITEKLNEAKHFFSEKSMKKECVKETVNNTRLNSLINHYESCLKMETAMQTDDMDRSFAEPFCTQIILSSIMELTNEAMQNLNISGSNNKDNEEVPIEN